MRMETKVLFSFGAFFQLGKPHSSFALNLFYRLILLKLVVTKCSLLGLMVLVEAAANGCSW